MQSNNKFSSPEFSVPQLLTDIFLNTVFKRAYTIILTICSLKIIWWKIYCNCFNISFITKLIFFWKYHNFSHFEKSHVWKIYFSVGEALCGTKQTYARRSGKKFLLRGELAEQTSAPHQPVNLRKISISPAVPRGSIVAAQTRRSPHQQISEIFLLWRRSMRNYGTKQICGPHHQQIFLLICLRSMPHGSY